MARNVPFSELNVHCPGRPGVNRSKNIGSENILIVVLCRVRVDMIVVSCCVRVDMIVVSCRVRVDMIVVSHRVNYC